MNKERWRPVPGCEGMYIISSHGRLWSAYTGRLLNPGRDRDGYLKVILCMNGRRKHVKVHQLVCNAFIGPARGRCCRHLDGNPSNNHLENLAYGSQAENISDKFLHGTIALGERHGSSKRTEKEIRGIRKDRKEGMTVREISVKYDIPRGSVSDITSRRTWKHLKETT